MFNQRLLALRLLPDIDSLYLYINSSLQSNFPDNLQCTSGYEALAAAATLHNLPSRRSSKRSLPTTVLA